jgi:flagellar motor switch protein FliN
MDSSARKKAAQVFAAAFAQALSEVLTEAAGAKRQLEVTDDGGTPAVAGAPIQYRIQVEGALGGECFVEFYESQIVPLLASVTGQRIDSLTEEHKTSFAKYVLAAVKKLETSTLTAYGDLNCKVEPVSGLSFGGMFVVAIAAPGAEPEMQILLFFGAQLLAGLSSHLAGESAQSAGASSSPDYNLDLVMDVELNVSLRFGNRQLSLREVLELESGSVVELDRLVDEPVELYLDGKLIARGEAVVVDGNYGLRVTEIPQPVASRILN